jgi:hypothetical protein
LDKDAPTAKPCAQYVSVAHAHVVANVCLSVCHPDVEDDGSKFDFHAMSIMPHSPMSWRSNKRKIKKACKSGGAKKSSKKKPGPAEEEEDLENV